MNDIDKLLSKHKPNPRRELNKNFTHNVIQHLDKHPKQSAFSSIKEKLVINRFAKPAVAVFALMALVGVGGTAYAAVGGWAGIQALFGGQQKVENARIVRVDTQNCTIINAFNITEEDKKTNVYYYKIKDDSKLSNDQVVQMVRGHCQSGMASKVGLDIAAELNKNPLNKDRIIGHYIDSEVTAMSSSHITIKSDMPINRDVKTFLQTFPLDPSVIVHEGITRLSLRDIKVGDHVAVKYRASGDALTQSETIKPGQIDTQNQPVVVIAKNSKDLSAAIDYQKYNGAEFEQVMPCGDDPSGYCNAEQYNKNK